MAKERESVVIDEGPPVTKAAAPQSTGNAGAGLPAGWSRYEVCVGDHKLVVAAPNEADAWAYYNDARGTSYGPKVPGRVIRKLEN